MHRDDDTDWTLLARFLAGECSPDERDAVERWVKARPERADELEELRQWWETAAALPPASRVDSMWAGLSRRMHADANGTDGVRATPVVAGPRRPVLSLAPKSTPPQQSWRVAAGAIAAGLMLVTGSALLWRAHTTSTPTASLTPAAREFATARGQRATIRLVDGTRVELGFASTLRVRPFDNGRRELYLEGEAVFDVVHDAHRPFIVHAANAITEDLGTTFGVRAYPGEDAVRVVVVSGRVALRSRQQAGTRESRSAVLGPGELGNLDAAGRLEVMSGVDTSTYVAWLNGRVAFHNARLDAVVAELERRFDITIHIPDPGAAARRVTVDMPARNVNDVLAAVTVPLGLRYRRSGGGFVVEK